MDRILLATDFSPRSDRALRRATLIAQRTGAAITLLHVVDGDQSEAMIEAEVIAARSNLTRLVETMKTVDRVDASLQVKIDDVFAGIASAAEGAAAELIVIGPHRKRLRDVFMGTTVERLLRQTSLPLLIAVQAPLAPYAHTLLALDFDEASRAAARAALALGVFDHTTVSAAHVVHAPARGMMQRGSATHDEVDAYVASEAREARDRVQRLVTELDLPVSHLHLITDQTSVALGLLDCAVKDAADLIVMGTNQRKGFERLLVGSVTEDVLREARRDILIVPVSCAIDT